jgi:hypothetical protein
LVQIPPVEPQAAVSVPATQLVPLQQPPWQGELPLQVVVHALVTGSQALPVGQSLAVLQPQCPVTHLGPAALPVQSTHCDPLPQALSAVPALQVPPLGAEQQPLVQACVEPQLFTQVPEVQAAAPPPQSPMLLQPQAPPPETARHTWPMVLAAQLAHRPPPTPQAVLATPLVQVLPLQQPPLQAWVASQLVVHWCALEQEYPVGQSVFCRQPQLLARHCVPALPPQEAQAPPPAPQAEGEAPLTQWLVVSQQPPLQVWLAVQVCVHWCELPSQA